MVSILVLRLGRKEQALQNIGVSGLMKELSKLEEMILLA